MAVSRFQDQNYEEIKRECQRLDILFRDDLFPANSSSLGVDDVVQWKRPKGILADPQFIVEGAKQFDVSEGKIGDCWFVAAVAAVIQHQQLFEQVVPVRQSFEFDYAGIFRFRFWRDNLWFEVVVDDQLPCNREKALIYLCNHNQPQEFWGPLLEKAYAKFNGSYSNLGGGVIEKALSELTGGVAYPNDIKTMSADQVWELLQNTCTMGCLITCSIVTKDSRIHSDRVTEEEINGSKGVLIKQFYTITKVDSVTTEIGCERLILVQNPWGKVEWNEPLTERSLNWKDVNVTSCMKYEVKHVNNGELWINVDDFVVNFHFLTICYPPGTTHLQTNGVPLQGFQTIPNNDGACGCRMF